MYKKYWHSEEPTIYEYQQNHEESTKKWPVIWLLVVAIAIALLITAFMLRNQPVLSSTTYELPQGGYSYELTEVKGVKCIFLKHGDAYIGLDCQDTAMDLWSIRKKPE